MHMETSNNPWGPWTTYGVLGQGITCPRPPAGVHSPDGRRGIVAIYVAALDRRPSEV